MNNFLLYIGAFFVIIFSTLLGVPYFVDWNSYRGVFEEEASRVLGRDVRVGGNVELKLLPSPYFQVEKIRIGSAASGETKGSFIKADDFRIWISIPPLLKGVLEAKSVELTKPVIQTVLDTEGRLALGSSQLKQGGFYSLFNNISLQSVKFIDGSLGFIAPNGSDLVRFENVNGELSADALDGPFRFAGEFLHKNETRQIRINTGKSDENGSLRFKAQVLSPNSTNTYAVDAVASDLFGRPSIEGEFKAKINGSYVLSKFLLGETYLDFEKAQQALNLEVNSLIKISGTRLALDEITINSESILPPKLLSGRSLLTWKDQLAVDISLSSPQIDFDKIFASEANDNTKAPLTLISALTKAFVYAWPEQAEVKFELSIDDLGITKQNIKALRFLAETVGNSVQIKEARALLPGDTKFQLSGEISGEKKARNLLGSLSLDGRSFNHFSHWLSKEGPLLKSEEDTSFSLSGDIKASSENMQLAKMKVLTNGSPWNGEVKLSFADRPRIKLDLQSEKMDLDISGQRTFLDRLDALTGALPLEGLSGEEKSSLSKGTKSAPWVQNVDWELNLKSSVLKRKGVEVQNFEWAATSKNKNIALSKIKFHSANEFAVALQSPTTDGSAPSKRTLEGKIEVLSPEAGEKIFKFLKTSEDLKKTFQNSAPITPWNFDCVFNFEESNEFLLDFNVRGSVRGGRAEISGFLHDPFGDWRKGPAKLNATVESPKIVSLFRADEKEKSPSSDFESNASGKLLLSSEGKPLEGMQTLAKVQTKDSEVEFKGALTFSDNSKLLKDGNLEVDSKNLNEFFLITGLLPQWTFQDVPLKGSLSVRDDGNKVYIKTDKILIGDASVAAEMSWASEKIERISGLEALVSVDHISASSLLSTLVKPLSKQLSDVEKKVSDQVSALNNSSSPEAAYPDIKQIRSIWSDATFDYSFLKHFDGVVRLDAGRLDFLPSVAIKNSKIELVLGQDAVQVKLVDGEALGGKAVSDFQIVPQSVGLQMKGQVTVDLPEGANTLKTDTKEKKTSLSGSLMTKFEGKATNPRNLIEMLDGKGQLEIKHLALQGEGPKSIIDVSKAFMKDKILNTQVSISESLKNKLKTAKWELKNISVPVEIAEAKLKFGKIEINSEYGNSSLLTDLDLQTLDLTSTWSLSALIPSADKEYLVKSQKKAQGADTFSQLKNGKIDSLPTVNIIYSGGLGNLETIEPKIIADALERELVVRRLELDVKELENLRKIDEEKSKLIPPPPEKGEPQNPENNNQIGNLSSGATKKEVIPHDTLEADQKNPPDVTSSTKTNDPSAQTQNLDLSEKKVEDQSSASPLQSTAPIPSTPNKDPLNQTSQNPTPPKIIKKKPSESYWPSFDFWPF